MRVRTAMANALGLGSVVAGVAPFAAPAYFGRMFGIRSVEDPTVATAVRSVGARDAIIGLAILRAMRNGDDKALRQWLLARLLCDAGDTVAVVLAVRGGARSPRFLGLGALALAATLVGIRLQRER